MDLRSFLLLFPDWMMKGKVGLILLRFLHFVSQGAVLVESNVRHSPGRVLSFVGEDVTLPCLYKAGVNDETVEWSREGLKPRNVVYLHRHGCETFEMKNEAYQFRTHLFMKELRNGNISLRLSDVRLSDAGKYRCHMMRLKKSLVTECVQLVVVSQPVISMSALDSGGVTLQCVVNCSLPELEMVWLDGQGGNISAQDPRRHFHNNRYTLRSTVTVQPTATNRFTCRVRQQTTEWTVDTHIEIAADCMKACTHSTVVCVVLPVGAVLAMVAFLAWKRRTDQSDQHKLLQSRQRSHDQSHDQALLQKDLELEDRVDHLESQLCERDAVIQQLQSFKKEHCAVCQHENSPTSQSPLDSPKHHDPPANQGPNARNVTHDKPKQNGSTLAQNKGRKPDLPSRHDDPTPNSPSHDKSAKQNDNDPIHRNPPHSNNPNHSIPDSSNGAAASSNSVSDNPLEQRSNASIRLRPRSLSLTGPLPHSNVSMRRNSLLANRYNVLAEFDDVL